ncbi:MAG: hypothetical protein IJ041_07675 [Clostridia bacterium]|nr:hypothetical protein [Clostridia bacterium]
MQNWHKLFGWFRGPEAAERDQADQGNEQNADSHQTPDNHHPDNSRNGRHQPQNTHQPDNSPNNNPNPPHQPQRRQHPKNNRNGSHPDTGHPVAPGHPAPIPPVDLSCLSCLVAPHEPDPFGCFGPPLTSRAAELSLELSDLAYTLNIVPWQKAGWCDFSFQIDDVLESDTQLPVSRISTAQDAAFRRLAELHRMRRARAALAARSPVGQMLAALRQREGSDTVKAVCMAHPLADGRHLIAIGFMGTGKRFYDWISNLRFTDEEGYHSGFYQLCRHFEQMADSIAFPQTARRLGLSQLTLGEILAELRRPDSRFRLWMAGHSQGGAVMQVFTHRLIHQSGALPQHICGWGFASPTAAFASLTHRPWDLPLWHVRNMDDLVPRIGAEVHLGRCLDYFPDEAFRSRCYRLSPLGADESCRRWLRPYLSGVRGTADNLIRLTALILCIADEKGEDAISGLMDKPFLPAALGRLRLFAGGQAQSVALQLVERLRRIYADLTGRPMDQRQLDALKNQLRPHVAETSLRRILSVMLECLTRPHGLREENILCPYELIVQEHLRHLQPSRWEIRCGEASLRRIPDGGGAHVKRPARGLKRHVRPQRRGARRI